MKICQIIETSGGGSGKTTLFLIQYLIGQGHEVTLIYSPLRAEPWFVNAATSIERLRVVALPMRRAVSWHDFITTIRLYKLLRRLGPFDMIHSHSSKAGGLARIAGIFLPKTKQIYTPHAFMTMNPGAHRFYALMEWALSWLCDGIIAVSQAEGNHAKQKLHIAARKIYIVPNGAEQNHKAERDDARRVLGFTEESFIIAFVGRLVPQKRPDRAIEVFARIAEKYSHARLAIVGDGPLENQARDLIAALKLESRVKIFAGYDARDLMPGFDVLLCSSDYEGFANIFLEALNEGVPIVTTPVGGADEAVIEGQTGFISTDFTPESLAQSLIKLIESSSQERIRRVEFARHHARNFTVEKMCENTIRIYRHMIAGSNE